MNFFGLSDLYQGDRKGAIALYREGLLALELGLSVRLSKLNLFVFLDQSDKTNES